MINDRNLADEILDRLERATAELHFRPLPHLGLVPIFGKSADCGR